MGLRQRGVGSNSKQYYLTDGNGRHLAFTDSLGNNEMDAPVYTSNGGNQAGTIEASTNFDNARAEVATAPGLSFYRNRYYDQRAGGLSPRIRSMWRAGSICMRTVGIIRSGTRIHSVYASPYVLPP